MPAPHNPPAPDHPIDLYDSAYGNYATDVYRLVRLATYGEDLGQTSWATNEESREIPQTLQLTPASRVLEILAELAGINEQLLGDAAADHAGAAHAVFLGDRHAGAGQRRHAAGAHAARAAADHK